MVIIMIIIIICKIYKLMFCSPFFSAKIYKPETIIYLSEYICTPRRIEIKLVS